MTLRCFGLTALALVLLAATSCTTGDRIVITKGEPAAPEGNAVDLYRIVPGDVLSIEGGKNEELSKEQVRVDEQGQINLLYIGKIEVADKTTSELEDAINQAYVASGKYTDSQVSVTVLTLYYYVAGQVRLPGQKQYMREIHLYRAIINAGGFTEFAAPARVLLLRPAPDGKNTVYKINVNRIMRGAPDRVVILPNDVIRVPKSVF